MRFGGTLWNVALLILFAGIFAIFSELMRERVQETTQRVKRAL